MDFEHDTSYTGPPVGDEAIRRAAERLRVTLPQRYIRVLRECTLTLDPNRRYHGTGRHPGGPTGPRKPQHPNHK